MAPNRAILLFVVASVLVACDTAALIVGGVGSGLNGGPNEAQRSIERRRDREADAQKANAETCRFLQQHNHEPMRLALDVHRAEHESSKDSLALDLAMAQANGETVAAYERHLKRIQESAKAFQSRRMELEAQAKDIEHRCYDGG